MRTILLTRILDDKNAGPFHVIRQVGIRAYELDLPDKMEL